MCKVNVADMPFSEVTDKVYLKSYSGKTIGQIRKDLLSQAIVAYNELIEIGTKPFKGLTLDLNTSLFVPKSISAHEKEMALIRIYQTALAINLCILTQVQEFKGKIKEINHISLFNPYGGHYDENNARIHEKYSDMINIIFGFRHQVYGHVDFSEQGNHQQISIENFLSLLNELRDLVGVAIKPRVPKDEQMAYFNRVIFGF